MDQITQTAVGVDKSAIAAFSVIPIIFEKLHYWPLMIGQMSALSFICTQKHLVNRDTSRNGVFSRKVSLEKLEKETLAKKE